jgi:choline dehydrogenase-like flavoprotein
VKDANTPGQPANLVTKLRTTVTPAGTRCSAYEAFLPTKFVESHKNLKICFGVVVQRIDIVGQDKVQRVQGVYLEDEKSSGQTFYVRSGNIILCAGAVASAQLLVLRCAAQGKIC